MAANIGRRQTAKTARAVVRMDVKPGAIQGGQPAGDSAQPGAQVGELATVGTGVVGADHFFTIGVDSFNDGETWTLG